MRRDRRSTIPFVVIVVTLCAVGALAVPVAAGAAGGPIGADGDRSDAAATVDEPPGTTAQGCFGAGGSLFTIGSTDAAHIWVRLHLGPFTDSGTSFGAELVGTAEDAATVEVAAGAEYVGDDLTALRNPLEAFAAVTGFEFRLPVFELDAPGLDEEPALEGDDAQTGDDDLVEGPFETLEC
ncbi:DUF7332 family protein [Halobiforma nitratireducens]|uniref:Uncharacterized protein n=1 Tax=Halobiforma nitratireducens JCM 10879 TaxID=1227454 RepID=M0M1V2_9EURY|nr:hypothetical protein [Halobiforma nitratireducens]EMA39666.1 hypothetical protein C446_08361 [Halobiforma nitratireducens JCM 10879]